MSLPSRRITIGHPGSIEDQGKTTAERRPYAPIAIRNLSEHCGELKSMGIEFALPETQIRPGTRIAMVKDPDGNIVKFVERS